MGRSQSPERPPVHSLPETNNVLFILLELKTGQCFKYRKNIEDSLLRLDGVMKDK